MSQRKITAHFRGPSSNYRDLLLLARQISSSSEKRAEQLLTSTRRNLAVRALQIRNRARRCGYKNGSRAAFRKLQSNLLKSQSRYETSVREAEQQCLELVLAIARKIIEKHLEEDPQALLKQIKNALFDLIDSRALKIKVPQGTEDYIYSELKDYFAERKFSIIGTKAVAPGHAVIETVSGSLELSWEDHLQAIRESLQNSLNRKQRTDREKASYVVEASCS